MSTKSSTSSVTAHNNITFHNSISTSSHVDHKLKRIVYVNESDDMAYNEKRSAHNALERQRREGLNAKFKQLAHVLPSLHQVHKPSKSLIVTKSLEFISQADEREMKYHEQIKELKKQNEQLIRQVERSKKKCLKKKKQNIHDSTTHRQFVNRHHQNSIGGTKRPSQDTNHIVKRQKSTLHENVHSIPATTTPIIHSTSTFTNHPTVNALALIDSFIHNSTQHSK